MNAEEERFRYLYKMYYYMLRNIAINRGIPENEADDAVQETFASFYAHYPLTWSDLHVKMVLIKIMRNLCVDYLRRKDNRPVDIYDPETLEDLLAFGAKKSSRDTLEIVMENLMFDDLLEGLRELKPEQLTVFVMYIIQGRTMDEISKVTGVSEAACRMRLTRARRSLEEYIRNHGMAGGRKNQPQIFEKPGLVGPSEDE